MLNYIIGNSKLTNEPVAIKVIPKANNLRQDLYIKQQINLIKGFHNPHVMGIIDSFESSNEYYLVMPLAQGGDLWHLLTEKKSLSENLISHLAKQILQGLHYIHDTQHIVHRYLAY